jgi:hypothetical protein
MSTTGAVIDDPLLSSTGTASGTANNIPGGSITLFAHYPGNGTLGSSDSTPVSVTVAPEPSKITTSVVNASGTAVTSATFGTPLTINVSVTGQSGFGTPTAGITIEDNSLPLDSFILNAAGAATTGPIPLMGGSNTITVHYVGDASFLPGDSAPVSVAIAKGSTTSTVSASPATIAPGASITLTANISTGISAAFPTGTVAFFSGTTHVGTAAFINSNPQNGLDNGVATLTTTSLPTGSDSITAQYSGDSNYAASTSPAIAVNVSTQPDFTITAAPSPISVTNPGQSATTTVTIAGSNGFNAATTFACSGLPAESACVFSMPTVTGSGTTTLTVTTTAPSFVAPAGRIDFNNRLTTNNFLRAVIFSIGLLALGIQARRRRWNFISSALVITLMIGTAACGGGSGGGGGVTPPSNPGTPMVQGQTVTVTATSAATASSAAITHTTTFILNVN